MAISNKFLHYLTAKAFDADVKAGLVQDGSIAFIKDVNAIWSHGKYFYCSEEKFQDVIDDLKQRIDLIDGGSLENGESIVDLIQNTLKEVEDVKGLIGTKEDESTEETIFGMLAKETEDREAAIEALNAEVEGESDHVKVKVTQSKGVITNVEVEESGLTDDVDSKISNSSTLKKGTNTYETAVSIKYVAADEETPAHIALVDKNEKELSSIAVGDLVGTGIVEGHSYDPETGILTLTFTKAGGESEDIEIDLSKMLDINDVVVDEKSKSYLYVDLSGEENSQAVFKALIVKMSEVSEEKTGLADAADVKKYVDDKVDAVTIAITGDDYVKATTANKTVSISTNIGTLNIDEEGNISGTAKTLVDGKEIADKVSSFVDGKISSLGSEIESDSEKVKVSITQENGVITAIDVVDDDVASAALLGELSDDSSQDTAFGKISKEVDDRKAAIEALDATVEGTGTNVKVKVDEEDGVLSGVTVTETYATVTRIPKSDGVDPKITITGSGLVKGTDLEDLKDYTVDIVGDACVFDKGNGTYSAVLKGYGTTALNDGEVAVGKYNTSSTGVDSSSKTAFSVGNGVNAADKGNAFEVRENGDIWVNFGSDYKKLQTLLSNEIDWYEGN